MHINVLEHGGACCFSVAVVWLLLVYRGLMGEVSVGKQTDPPPLCKRTGKKVGYSYVRTYVRAVRIVSCWLQVG